MANAGRSRSAGSIDAIPTHRLRTIRRWPSTGWSVRIGSEEGEELATDFEWSQPFGEPDRGDVFSLPDGLGPWRVEDIRKRDAPDSPEHSIVGAEG